HGAVLEYEMVPRRVMPRRARARERKLLEAQRAEITIEIAGGRRAAGERFRGARLERAGEMIDRNLPLAGIRLAVQPLDDRLVYPCRHPAGSRYYVGPGVSQVMLRPMNARILTV